MAEPESTILIVDDDADDLVAVKRALSSLGARILAISDPHEVLSTVRRELPDVVVLDALLPGLSGFDLCKEIKTDAALRTTQILIVTAVYLRQQYRHEALQQFKADAFLTKPFRPPELQRLVVQLLSRKTRRPQAKLLSRLGLPAKPAKRGLLGRLFGRGEEVAPEDTRLTPPRKKRRSPEGPVSAESAPEAKQDNQDASSSPPTEPAPAAESGTAVPPLPPPESDAGEPGSVEADTGSVEADTDTDTGSGSEKTPDEPDASLPASDSASETTDFELAGEPEAPTQRGNNDHQNDGEPAGSDVQEEEEEPSVERVAAAAEPEPVALEASDVPPPEAATVTAEGEVVEGEAKAAGTGAPPTEVVEGEVVEAEAAEEAEIVEADVAASDHAESEPVEKSVEPSDAAAAPASRRVEGTAALEGSADEPGEKPSAAEMLETPVSQEAPDIVSTPAAESEASPSPVESASASEAEQDEEESDQEREETARPELGKTLPEVELPESLVAASASPAPVEADGSAEPGSSSGQRSVETTEREPTVEPAPLAEPASSAPVASEGTTETDRSEPRPRRRPRRLGEAPVFEEEEFGPELRRELSKCRRVDRPLTLILIQVEDLDQIVELFGKEFREDVLWHVAEQAMVSLREVDVVGMISSKDRIAMTAFASDRYGGSRIVTRMRRTVGKHPIRVGEELPPIVPALVFGMASYPEDAEDPESLLSRAEEELKGTKAHRED